MKKTVALVLIASAIFGGLFVLAASDKFSEYVARAFGESFFSEQFALGKILSIQEETLTDNGITYRVQTMEAELLTGPERGEETELRVEGEVSVGFSRDLHEGQIIVVGRTIDFDGPPYYFSDRFRLPVIIVFVLAFIAAVIMVARLRGLTSLLGLGVTAIVLLGFIIPNIIEGRSALWVILLGTFVIAIASLYLAHGFNKRTSVAVLGTLITLTFALLVAILFVRLANIVGIGTEEVFYLKIGLAELNVTGLLLGSILIGALGVLDDITIGQAATVEQIRHANPALTVKDLYERGMAVGREHIASLVNTLVLAYAGTSFPLLLLFILNRGFSPLWSIWNGEILAEEIVRTVVGSLALVLAVPITTFLAAYYFGRRTKETPEA